MDDQMRETVMHNMTLNLPTLRCKMGASQEDLAAMVGVCRSTISNIENKRQPLQWSLFLSLLMIFTNNEETKKLLEPMGIYSDDFKKMIFIKSPTTDVE